ncbi:MAG: MFS transporter [Planctomycetes bacterium]|nr:MFS transporter [Planctomycetota bacterium]
MKLVEIKKSEIALTLLSGLYFFFLLTSYYILRPMREAEGAERSSTRLAWLFTATCVTMIAMQPLYGWVVSRWPRRVFIPWVYRFFGLNLGLFFLLWRFGGPATAKVLSDVFFVWVSVFNLFVVAVFWSFMADIFREEQSKRLFGLIAVGGSIGAVTGAQITRSLVGWVGNVNMLLVSLVVLELATQCMLWIARLRGPEELEHAEQANMPEAAQVGDAWNGLRLILRSPFLRLVAAHFFLASSIGTVLYFEQKELVQAGFPDKAARTQAFASIDVWTNAATFLVQLFVTGRLVKRMGIGFALMLGPVAAVVMLVAMAISPTLGVLIAAQIILRTLQHATTRPAREMIFTVVGREVKYKSKGFIDTFVYRFGDQLGSWGFTGLFTTLGLALGPIAWVTVPVTLTWCAVARALGRAQKKLARDE